MESVKQPIQSIRTGYENVGSTSTGSKPTPEILKLAQKTDNASTSHIPRTSNSTSSNLFHKFFGTKVSIKESARGQYQEPEELAKEGLDSFINLKDTLKGYPTQKSGNDLLQAAKALEKWASKVPKTVLEKSTYKDLDAYCRLHGETYQTFTQRFCALVTDSNHRNKILEYLGEHETPSAYAETATSPAPPLTDPKESTLNQDSKYISEKMNYSFDDSQCEQIKAYCTRERPMAHDWKSALAQLYGDSDFEKFIENQKRGQAVPVQITEKLSLQGDMEARGKQLKAKLEEYKNSGNRDDQFPLYLAETSKWLKEEFVMFGNKEVGYHQTAMFDLRVSLAKLEKEFGSVHR